MRSAICIACAGSVMPQVVGEVWAMHLVPLRPSLQQVTELRREAAVSFQHRSLLDVKFNVAENIARRAGVPSLVGIQAKFLDRSPHGNAARIPRIEQVLVERLDALLREIAGRVEMLDDRGGAGIDELQAEQRLQILIL